MNKKRAVLAVVIVLAAAGAMAWWYDVPERMGWVRPRTEGGNLTLYGNVDIRQVQLGFRVGGRLVESLVDEGDPVKAGDALAHLDAQPYRYAVDAAQARVASARAVLEKLETGPRESEIARAKADHNERLADLQNAQQVYERVTRLQPGGTVSEARLDQARAERDMAAARSASALQALQLLEEGTRAEDVAAARADLQGAEANLSAANTSLRDNTLLAPSDGVILSRVREPGAIVSPSDIVYVLSLTRPVWVRTYISEVDLGRIHPGMEVTVTTDTVPDHPYKGKVGFISPVAEFTPKSVETPELRTDLVYRLRVLIDEPDEALRQGMPVTVHLDTRAGSGS
jgi:HlyD family secretion protein